MATEKHTNNTATESDNWVLWIVLALLFVVSACGSQASETEAAEASEPVAEEVEATTAAPTTTETPTTTAPTTAAPTTTVPEIVADDEVVETAAEVGTVVESRFELTGEVDLTTEEINDMIEFVETAAGREFLHPPRIEVLSIEEFEAGLVPDPELEAAIEDRSEANTRLYQALGFTDQGVEDFTTSLADLGRSTDFISGRYDPFDDVVLIPEGVLTGDEFNAILVHELLHALDGQHVDLAGLLDRQAELISSTVATDETFAIAAVIEGRATAVQFDWMIANNAFGSQSQEIPEVFNSVPAAAINSVLLPYQLGAQSITELGGAAETWHLYDEFPESSEQMVFPSRIGTDAPIDVDAPEVDGEVFFEGTNGVEGVLVLGLGDTLQPDPALIFQILGAAEGWGGDYFILSGDETQSCLTGNIVADTPEDLDELESLFTGWAGRDTGATRTATVQADMLTISSCAPFTA